MTNLETPEGHPEVDWDNWKPPGEGDVRSPCPAINALANHGILPHSGKDITKKMAVQALTQVLHLDSITAAVFSSTSVSANPDHEAHDFDLNHVSKHGFIEHDVSLSRDDLAFGSNAAFSKERWGETLAILKAGSPSHAAGEETVSWANASKARYSRVAQQQQRHKEAGKDFNYGLKEVLLSYGESALYLNVLGKDGVAPLEWVRILFEEERFPFKEGWRPPVKVDQIAMNHAMFKLIQANEHKDEEASLVGLGTFHALEAAVMSLIRVPSPSNCTVM